MGAWGLGRRGISGTTRKRQAGAPYKGFSLCSLNFGAWEIKGTKSKRQDTVVFSLCSLDFAQALIPEPLWTSRPPRNKPPLTYETLKFRLRSCNLKSIRLSSKSQAPLSLQALAGLAPPVELLSQAVAPALALQPLRVAVAELGAGSPKGRRLSGGCCVGAVWALAQALLRLRAGRDLSWRCLGCRGWRCLGWNWLRRHFRQSQPSQSRPRQLRQPCSQFQPRRRRPVLQPRSASTGTVAGGPRTCLRWRLGWRCLCWR